MTDAVGHGAASGQAQRAFLLQHALSFSRKQPSPEQTSFSAVLDDTTTRTVAAAAAPAVAAAESPTVEQRAVAQTAAPSVTIAAAAQGATADEGGSSTFSIEAFFDRDPTTTKWLTWHLGQIDLFRAAVNSLFPNRTPRPLIPSGTWQAGSQASSTQATHTT